MLEDYKNALRAGQRATRAAQARGQSPYLAVLDDILRGVNIVAQEPLGLVDIPAESIVGTKTAGRHTAFASNFMPLLDDDTEFAVKWSNLCDAHLEEGIHTPIIAFEYLNKFYVQEGNKRVSVLKYYEAVKIPGTVTRLIPAKNDTLENKLYYEFLDFYKFSRINYVSFSRLGGYAKLQALACKATGEAWTEDDRLNFSSLYTMFSQQFYALGGSALELTPGDALLVYLSVYRYSDACQSTPSQVRENLAKLWDEIKILTRPQAVELQLEPATKQGAASTFLRDTLRRISLALGQDEEAFQTTLARSFLVSADNAHAIHPDHPEYADRGNCPRMNGGVVIKFNANQRYATDGRSCAVFRAACAEAGVPVQLMANRSDLPGGSTLGSIAGTLVPVSTVDIGLAQLAMHSSWETMGAQDCAYLAAAAARILETEL